MNEKKTRERKKKLYAQKRMGMHYILGVIKEDLARKGAEVVWVLQTSVTGAAEIAGASEVPCLWPLV